MTNLPPSLESPPSPSATETAEPRPFGFDLQRIALATALAIPIGMAYFWNSGVAAPWAWAGGCVWMLGNLYCLDRMIRSLLAPPEERDNQSGAVYGALTLLVMPVLLLALLFGANQGEAMAPVAAGITLPLVLVLLRALGTWISAGSKRGKAP